MESTPRATRIGTLRVNFKAKREAPPFRQGRSVVALGLHRREQ